MTALLPQIRALFEDASVAASKGFETPGKTKNTALHEWLCAEICFADEVGMGFVMEPQKNPQKDWQCQAYAEIAKALRSIRINEFADCVRATV